MNIRSVPLFLSFCLFFGGCNDGGMYGTLNPPVDGVVIGGTGNGVSGYLKVGADPASPSCTEPTQCEMSLSNRSFVTLQTPIPVSFLQNDQKLGISISYGESGGVVYIYKRNGQNLERDNFFYTGGVFPKDSSFNLISLKNEQGQEILVRGVFSLKKTAKHPENTLLAYFSLKSKLFDGQTLSVCVSTIDESATTIETFVRTPADCFTIKP